MPLSSSHEPVLPTAWIEVLKSIQRVLAGALKAADARAAAFEALPPEQPMTLANDSELLAPTLDAPLPCEQQMAETEQALASSQEALDRWLATAAQVGQRLAEQASRAV
jgi:hypothetical protein